MRQIIVVLIFILVIVGGGVLHQHTVAQQVVAEEPLINSPTYVAVPPRQQELITAEPSPQHVWVSGQWERTPDSWAWSAGKWIRPPFSNAYWVPGYWKHRSGQYVWQSAHWGVANQGVVVTKPVAVPPVYAEVQPAAPTRPLQRARLEWSASMADFRASNSRRPPSWRRRKTRRKSGNGDDCCENESIRGNP